MTLVSIFCSFVRRLPTCQDIEVRPIGFPGTVLAGLRIRGGGSEDWVYVNPFSAPRGRLPTRAALKAMLVSMGTSEDPSFFRPASAREMVREFFTFNCSLHVTETLALQCTRVGRNILTSIQTRQVTSQNVGIACLYSVAHSLFAFNNHDHPHRRNRTPPNGIGIGLPNYTDWLTSIIQAEYPYDVSFLSARVLPLLRTDSTQTIFNHAPRISKIEGLVESIMEEDVRGVGEMKWVAAKIKWRIGHVFRHRLFGYHAVVRGWDYKCEASETCESLSLSLSQS